MANGVPFSDFTSGGTLRTTDITVGLRDGINYQYINDGVNDEVGVKIITYSSLGADAINYIDFTNGLTTDNVIISALSESDTDVGITLQPLGVGKVLINTTSALSLPAGTTAQQPAGVGGDIRYNTEDGLLYYYDAFNAMWQYLSNGSGTVVQVDGTTNQINVDNTDPANPVVSLSPTIVLPGTLTTSHTVTLSSLTASTLLSLSAAKEVASVAPVNSAIMRTTNTGAFGWSASMTNGQIIIGSTGATPVLANITPGSGIIVTNGAGSIQISSTGNASALTKSITQVAHGFNVGDVVYLNSTTYTKAQANASSTAEGVGIVSAVADADNFTLLISGYITGLSGLTAGTISFLSDSVAGALTTTEPTTSGYVSKPLLWADSTTSGYFINMRGKIIPNPVTLTTYINQTSSTATASDLGVYLINNGASLVTITIPATTAVGFNITVIGNSSGGWKVQANTGQTIHVGSASSTSAGSVSSSNQYDCVTIICTVANTTFSSYAVQGTLTTA